MSPMRKLVALGVVACTAGCFGTDPAPTGTEPYGVDPPVYAPSADCSVRVGGEGWHSCEGTTNCLQYDVGAIKVAEPRQIRLSLSNDCDHGVIVTMNESDQPDGSVVLGGGDAPNPDAQSAEVPLDPAGYEQMDPYVQALPVGPFVLQCDLYDAEDTTVAHGFLRIVGSGY